MFSINHPYEWLSDGDKHKWDAVTDDQLWLASFVAMARSYSAAQLFADLYDAMRGCRRTHIHAALLHKNQSSDRPYLPENVSRCGFWPLALSVESFQGPTLIRVEEFQCPVCSRTYHDYDECMEDMKKCVQLLPIRSRCATCGRSFLCRSLAMVHVVLKHMRDDWRSADEQV